MINDLIINPNFLTGAIAAFEGIKGIKTIINIPSKSNDLSKFLDHLKSSCINTDEFIVIINTPYSFPDTNELNNILQDFSLESKVFVYEVSDFSFQHSCTYNKAMSFIVNKFCDKDSFKTNNENSLNIIVSGINLLTPRWKDNIEQLKEELALSGINKVTSLGAGSTVSELKNLNTASVIVSANETYGRHISKAVSEKYVIPFIDKSYLAPIGIPAAEEWLFSVVESVGANNEPVKQKAEEIRKTVNHILKNNNYLKGKSFIIAGDSAIVAPLILYLDYYIGMHPLGMIIRERAVKPESLIDDYISTKNIDCKVIYSPDSIEESDFIKSLKPEIILGASRDQAIAKLAYKDKIPFVNISYPGKDYLLEERKPLMGLQSSITILESIINEFSR